jgi:polygalacturonase
MKKIFIIASLLLISLAGTAQDKQPLYKSSFFGIRSNGTTDNTTSIQKAIDFIASKGGGTLEFSVGRYLTGAVELKSGVNISLREGAVIVGSTNIYAYDGKKGIFWGEGISDVSIYGKGVIEGNGPELIRNIREQIKMRHISDDTVIPTLVYLKDCKGVTLQNFICRYPATRDNLYIIEGGDVKVDGCYTDTL